ncbi:MAG: alpha/beta fold hydrolase [Myxococcales bacterium]
MNFATDAGRGPAVLFLHGMPSPAAGLAPFWRALLAGHRVLVPELPGYGRSASPEGGYDFAKVNELIEAELGSRGVRELHGVVAFSGGAYRALLLALDGKTPVGRLALLGGSAGPEASERPLFAQFAALVRAGPIGPQLVGLCRERLLSPAFRQAHPERVAEVDGWLHAPARELLAEELDAYARAPDLLPRLGALKQPILARVGAQDAACPPAKSEAIARAARQTLVQVVPEVGHALELEDAQGTAGALEQFFA